MDFVESRVQCGRSVYKQAKQESRDYKVQFT